MMSLSFYRKILASASLLLLLVPAHALAAHIFLVPERSVVGPKDTIIVDVRIDSAGVGFNAAQATIRFPKNLLLAGDAETKSSAFSFWLEQPTVSNEQGALSFTGGTPYGVSGGSIQILRLFFTPKGTGSGTLSIVDAAITASDGSGANILSTTTDTTITVSPTRVSAPAGVSVVPTIATSTTVVTPRTPAVATVLPSASPVRVPLYPDGTAWYSTVSPFTVSWTLSPDVSGVNTAITRQPNAVLPQESKGIFDSESFDALSDGVWYAHVRFENNLGWGQTLHRRIALDTVPPANFRITQVGESDPTTPTATLAFNTSDALSGLAGYRVRIDGADLPMLPADTFKGAFTTPLLVPGDHAVSVQALDLAGNSVISTSTVRIASIDAPVITVAPTQLYIGDNRGLTLQGTAQPKGTVLVSIFKDTTILENGSVVAGADGNWAFTSKQVLPTGTFVAHVRSQDARGAKSNAVLSSPIIVEEKPVIQFGIFSLDMKEAIVLLLVILFGGIAGGWWLYRARQDVLFMRLLSTEADMAKVFTMIRADVAKLRAPNNTKADIELAINRIDANIEKMEEYLRHEMQNINK